MTHRCFRGSCVVMMVREGCCGAAAAASKQQASSSSSSLIIGSCSSSDHSQYRFLHVAKYQRPHETLLTTQKHECRGSNHLNGVFRGTGSPSFGCYWQQHRSGNQLVCFHVPSKCRACIMALFSTNTSLMVNLIIQVDGASSRHCIFFAPCG